jgi:aspartyl-tRNA(Asn)/glutamyl-tRNA(Gln) amidotransferase subunit C
MISQEVIKKAAHLAKLNFKTEELKNLGLQLNNIEEMIHQITEVNCAEIKPLKSVIDMKQPMRTDQVTDGNKLNEVFKNVPIATADISKNVHCFAVPKVIE